MKNNRMTVSELGTILCIWAHPDDEAYSMAGVMAAASQNGQKVVCVTATRGEAARVDERRWRNAKLAEIRTEEMAQSLKIVGCKDHTWLDYPDGDCKGSNEVEAVSRLVEIIKEVQPDSVFTFGHDWQLNRHLDHQAISEWTTRAFRQGAKPGAKLYYTACSKEMATIIQANPVMAKIFFEGGEVPDVSQDGLVAFELTPELADIKEHALAAHASQVEGIRSNFGDLYPLAQKYEYFRLALEK